MFGQIRLCVDYARKFTILGITLFPKDVLKITFIPVMVMKIYCLFFKTKGWLYRKAALLRNWNELVCKSVVEKTRNNNSICNVATTSHQYFVMCLN